MLNEVFKALIIPSLAGAMLAGMITIARPLTKRIFGFSWHYYIWLAVLIVMLLPARVNMSGKKIPEVYTQPVQGQLVTYVEALQDLETQTLQTAPRPEFIRQISVARQYNYLGIIWLTGALIMLFVYLIGYIRLLIRLRKRSVPTDCPDIKAYTDKNVRVLICSDLSSPFMLGIFRPTLVLPERELSPEQLDNILQHEMTHFRRRDILYKWFAVFVKCVHWFNPIVYYVNRQINTECEISCDLSVVSRMNTEEESCYINTILSLVSGEKSKAVPLTTGMTGSKRTLKRRFIMIKNRRTTSKIMSVMSAIIAIAALSATIFTSGAFAGEVFANRDITVTLGGNVINLHNHPFIANNTVYLPLREMLNFEGVTEITYSDGYVEFPVYSEEPIIYRGAEYDHWKNRVQIGSVYAYIAGHSGGSTENAEILSSPVVIDGVTYVPYDLFLKLKDAEGIFNDLTLAVSGADSLAGTLYRNDEANVRIEIPLSLCGNYDIKYAILSTTDFESFTNIYFSTENYASILFYIQRLENAQAITDSEVVTLNDALYTYVLAFPDDTALTDTEAELIKSSFDTIVKIGTLIYKDESLLSTL